MNILWSRGFSNCAFVEGSVFQHRDVKNMKIFLASLAWWCAIPYPSVWVCDPVQKHEDLSCKPSVAVCYLLPLSVGLRSYRVSQRRQHVVPLSALRCFLRVTDEVTGQLEQHTTLFELMTPVGVEKKLSPTKRRCVHRTRQLNIAMTPPARGCGGRCSLRL